MKDAEDNITPEEYDRLFNAGAYDPDKAKKPPPPQPPPSQVTPPNVNIPPKPVSHTRRNFLIGLGAAGTATLLYLLTNETPKKASPALPTVTPFTAKRDEVMSVLRPSSPSPLPPPTATIPRFGGLPSPTPDVAAGQQLITKILDVDFLGPDEIAIVEKKLETFWGDDLTFKFIYKGGETPILRYSLRDLELAKENNEMLVLRPDELSISKKGISATKDGPITISRFSSLLSKNDRNNFLVNILLAYPDETELEAGFALVKKYPLNNSLNKTWSQQEDLLIQYKEYIKGQGGSQVNVRRRSGIESLWDIVVDGMVNNRQQPLGIGDWTRSTVDNDHFIYVKQNKANSQILEVQATSQKGTELGVYPSR